MSEHTGLRRPLRILHYNVLFSAAWDPDADAFFRFDADAQELVFRHAMKKYRKIDWREAFGDLQAAPTELQTSAAEEELERRRVEQRKDIRGLGNQSQNAAFYFEGLPWEKEIPVYLMKKIGKTGAAGAEGLNYYAKDEARLWRRLDEALQEHDPHGELRLKEKWERRWSDAVVAQDPRVVALRAKMQTFIDLFAGDRRRARLEAKLEGEIGEWERDGVPLVACLTEVAESWAPRWQKFFEHRGFASHFERGSVSGCDNMGTLLAYPRRDLRVLSRRTGGSVLQALGATVPSRDRIRAYLKELDAGAAAGATLEVRSGAISVPLCPSVPFPYSAEEVEQVFGSALEAHNRKPFAFFHFEFLDSEDVEQAREGPTAREERAEKRSRDFVLAPYHMPMQVHYRVPSSGKHAGRMVMGLHAHGIARLLKGFVEKVGAERGGVRDAAGRGADAPVVLIGDWNIVSDSPLFGLMEGDCLRMKARADPALEDLVRKPAENFRVDLQAGNAPMASEDCMVYLAPLVDLLFREGRGLHEGGGTGPGNHATLCAALDDSALELRSVYHRWFAHEAPREECDAGNACGFVTTRTQEFCAALDHTFVSGAVGIGAVRKMRTEEEMAERGLWNPDFADEPSDHQMQVQVLRM